MKDSEVGTREDLMWFVYSVFDFIEHAPVDQRDNMWGCTESIKTIRHRWDKRGRVLVHCAQGVSRSCAFCIAFIMWRNGSGFQEAYISQRRQLSSDMGLLFT